MKAIFFILAFALVAIAFCAVGFYMGARGAGRYYARELAAINREFSERDGKRQAENPQSQQGA